MTVVELGRVSAILVSCSRSCVCQKLFIKSQCVYSFFFKTLWDENLRGGWSQSFFFIIFSYAVVLEQS